MMDQTNKYTKKKPSKCEKNIILILKIIKFRDFLIGRNKHFFFVRLFVVSLFGRTEIIIQTKQSIARALTTQNSTNDTTVPIKQVNNSNNNSNRSNSSVTNNHILTNREIN